ncbi:MAG: hypothetical protein ACI88A_004763 [Paraglaciecola sp.]|jgi:hypothetical protein
MGGIIFHPGIGKTATSAIQLLGSKLPVDDTNKVCFSPHGYIQEVHNVFADNHPQFDAKKCQVELRKLIEFAGNRNADTIVSSEFLIFSSAMHIRKILNAVKNAEINVKVIVSVRNYTDYLMSSYMQAVKVKWGMKSGESMKSYATRELNNIRLLILIDQWAREVGDENVSILEYDKFNQNFVAKFFNTIGVKKIDAKESSQKTNNSLPFSCASVLLEFDKVCSNPEKRLNLRHFLSTCHYDIAADDVFKTEVSAIVKNAYNHDFKRLSERYLIIS